MPESIFNKIAGQSLFFNKIAQVFSCELCEICKNIFFTLFLNSKIFSRDHSKSTYVWPTLKLAIFFCVVTSLFADTPSFCCRFFSLIWPLVPPPVTSFLSGHNIVRFVNYYCLNNTVMLRLCRLFPNLKLFQILLFRFYLRKFVNDLVIYPAKKKACKILNWFFQ